MKKIILTILITALTVSSFAQSSLYISSGASVVVSGGTTLVVDSLALKPTANFTITGANSVTRDAITVPASPTTYIKRVYHFLATLPAFTGDITHYYQDAELNGLNENLLNLNLYNGASWTLYPASTRDNVNNFVTTTGLTNVVFNQATLAEVRLLPVTLTNVSAYQKNKGVQVEWRSEHELNIDSYEVERSQTGVQFAAIGKIAARNNNGGTVDYSIFDGASQPGLNYYRIKITGQSGDIKYSMVLKINIGKAIGNFSIYPNPVTGNSVGLQINNMPAGIYTVNITNAQGQHIATTIVNHSGGAAAALLDLPKAITPGVYQLEITGNGLHSVERFIKR